MRNQLSMDFEKNIGRYIGRLSYLGLKRMNELLTEAGTGITADQFRLLTHLWKQDGIPQQQLALILGRDRAGVTRMIDILENQHIITRIADINDRRINLIFLTKTGKELETKAAECAQKYLNEIMEGFSEDEKQQFSDLLLRAVTNLKKQK